MSLKTFIDKHLTLTHTVNVNLQFLQSVAVVKVENVNQIFNLHRQGKK